jgi:hypothetical protein
MVLDAEDAIAMLDDNRMANATGALCLAGFARRRAALLQDWAA